MLDLKAGDKLMVNGAVIECVSAAKLLVHDQAAVLRRHEILSEADAVTPAARTYFALQCAYAFADRRAVHLEQARTFLDQYVTACPSARPVAEAISAAIAEDRLYQGLKHARDLLRHESMVLNAFAARLEDRLATDNQETSQESVP